MSEENKDYIKISQLEETRTMNPAAMFMVSDTTTSDGNYVSKRMQLGELSGQIYRHVVNGITQAAQSLSAVDKANSLDDIKTESQVSAIVTVQAAREMYNDLKNSTSTIGNYLKLNNSTNQDVTGPVYFSGGLSCDTTGISTSDNLVVNCKMLRENNGRYPFIVGYGHSSDEIFSGDGAKKWFIVGFEKSCTANIKIFSPRAQYIGLAVFRSGNTNFDTINTLKELAEQYAEDENFWYPIEYFAFAQNQIHTRCIPCDKNTVLMFYSFNTSSTKIPKGIDDNTLFGKENRIAIINDTKIKVDQYIIPQED